MLRYNFILFSILKFSFLNVLCYCFNICLCAFIILLFKLAMQLVIQKRGSVLFGIKLSNINLMMVVIMPEFIPIPAHHQVNTEVNLVLIPVILVAELIA